MGKANKIYCTTEEQTILRRRRKRKYVDLLGGECSRCGVLGPIVVFDFHHRDPSKKKYSVAVGINADYVDLEEEVKKCDLVCSNCHRIIHNLEQC